VLLKHVTAHEKEVYTFCCNNDLKLEDNKHLVARKPEGNNSIQRPRQRWEGTIKMEHKSGD